MVGPIVKALDHGVPVRLGVTSGKEAEERPKGVGRGCDDTKSSFDGGPDIDISAKRSAWKYKV
jgi:hypothetical protein